jgi:hypothetical protein
MDSRTTTLRPALLAAAVMAIFAAQAPASAQINDRIRGAPSETNHFIETPSGWQHPQTPWGEPDIRAQLNMMQAAGVPLERCANSYRAALPPGAGPITGPAGGVGAPAAPCDMNKKWLTDEEFAERMEAFRNRVDASRQFAEQGNLGRAMMTGLTDPNIPQRQTNLIVDPPDGLLPPMTAEGKRRALLAKSDWALPGETIPFDGPDDFDSWDRCITRGMPSSMMPYRYNGGFRIWQAPGVVVFELEMIHDARVIYTDGRPPLKAAHKGYMGDSRGRWEGNTLVIETANYKGGHAPLINLAVVGSPPGNRFPQSDQMKTTERITRVNDEMWLYEIKTEDPVILTAPFTVRYPMRHDPTYEWWEYACHEGNTIVPNYSNTSRHERANPEPEPAVEALDANKMPVTLPAGTAVDQARMAVRLPADLARTITGRWVGTPEIKTIEYDIVVEFTANPDGTVVGRLIETTLPDPREVPINRPLRGFTINGRRLNFTFPNTQTWGFQGELSADGTAIAGVTNSAQGGLRLTFRKR